MIRFEDVHFSYRPSLFGSAPPTPALAGVSFRLEAGRCLGIIGGNGSGKTTLLKLAAGILGPDRGSVSVEGPVGSLLELGAAFDPTETGRENLRVGGVLWGIPHERIEAEMGALVEFSGLAQDIDRPVREYSSGMAMRLAFSLVTLLRAKALVVDEVLAVGDESFRRRSAGWLESFRRDGGALLLASHDLRLVSEHCDELLWLEGGVPRLTGAPGRVLPEYLREKVRRDVSTASAASSAGLLEHVEVLDGAGRPCGTFRAGEGMRLRVTLARDPAPADAGLRLAVFRSDWTLCFYQDSRDPGGMRLPAPPAHVELRIDELSLQPGSYLVSAALLDTSDLYHDYVPVAAGFEVTGEGPARGVFHPTCGWTASSS